MTCDQKLRQTAFAVAYRMLGNADDAEDIAQSAMEQWLKHKPFGIEPPEAYIATIAARTCLNFLRNRKSRNLKLQRYGLPVPLAEDVYPGADARIDLSYGVIVLTLSLSPMARAVFILRNAFDLSFKEIAIALERTPATCRQAHMRAQKLLHTRPAQLLSSKQQVPLLEKLVQTISAGDIEGLTALLSADIVLRSDGGGEAPAFGKPITGQARIANFLTQSPRILNDNATARIIAITGGHALLLFEEDKLAIVVIVEEEGDRIANMYALSDPVKLIQFQRHIEV